MSNPFNVKLGLGFDVGDQLPKREPILDEVDTEVEIDEIETPTDEEVEEEMVVDPPTPEIPDEVSEDDDKEGSVGERTYSSLAAEYYKRKGSLPDDFEVTDDLSAEELFSAMEEHVGQRKGEEIEDKYRTLGYDEDLLEYSKYIRNGGSPEVVQIHTQYNILANFNVDEEENQELVVKYMLQDQGMDPDIIDTTVESLRMDDKLEGYSTKAKTYFGKKRDAYFAQAKKEQEDAQEAQKRAIEKQREDFRKVIRKGDFGGLKLTAGDSKKLEKDFLEPTEKHIITLDDGSKQVHKVTKFEKRMFEVQQDPDKMLELAYYVLNGFKGVVQQEKEKAREDLLSALDAKTKIRVDTQRKPETTNNNAPIRGNILFRM
jgi:hypothetical protein